MKIVIDLDEIDSWSENMKVGEMIAEILRDEVKTALRRTVKDEVTAAFLDYQPKVREVLKRCLTPGNVDAIVSLLLKGQRDIETTPKKQQGLGVDLRDA